MSGVLRINSDKCSGCGACLVYTNWIREANDGEAQVKELRILNEYESNSVQELVDLCLEGAIHIEPIVVDNRVDLSPLIYKAMNQLLNVQVPEVKAESLKAPKEQFNYDGKFRTSFDYGKYKSYEKAIDAIFKLFKREAYQERDKAIMSVLQEYKEKYLSEYYLFTDNSFYGKINRQISSILNQLKEELYTASGGRVSLPNDFAVVNIYPSQLVSKNTLETVTLFESVSRARWDVDHEYRDSTYTSADDYRTYLDADDFEMPDRTWWRGRDTREAIAELAKDLQDATGWTYIEDIAAQSINELIKPYRAALEKLMHEKISLAKRAL